MSRIRVRIKNKQTGEISSEEFDIDKEWNDISPQDVRQHLKEGEVLYGYALLKEVTNAHRK